MTLPDRDRLPPVIAILLDEAPPDDDFASTRRWYRRLSPEIRRQAEWTLGHYSYAHPQKTAASLVAAPAVGLDPCRSDAKCILSECRMKATRQFVRTVGLYADHVVLADEPTLRLLTTPRFSVDQAYQFATTARILHELRPMIDAGLISFRDLGVPYCKTHYKQFESAISGATNEILEDLKVPLSFEVQEQSIFIDLAELYGYPQIQKRSTMRGSSHLNRKQLENMALRVLRDSAEFLAGDTALVARDASEFKGTLISSSRISALLLRKLEGNAPNSSLLDSWELARSVDLPWVRELSVQGIVRLREEAADALPRLRETLGTAMQGDGISGNDVANRVHQLREEAAEVKSELKALRSRHESSFRNAAGLLGLTVSVYGFGADILPAAASLGSLMTLLGLLHNSEQKDFAEVQRIRSKPGYVLVKAQELLDHAHD